MMTILSFLGGTAFRLIFGEIAAFFSKKQAHAQEIERMRLQDQIDAGRYLVWIIQSSNASARSRVMGGSLS